MKTNTITVGILLLFIFSSFSVIGQQQIDDTFSSTPNIMKEQPLSMISNHEPIIIEGNGDFIPENGVTGGSGTENDPFIIEGWTITDDNTTDTGIFINNTDVFFILRNCTIMNFIGTYEHGIEFNNVKNGIIEKTTTYRNQVGASIRYSDSIVIREYTSYNYSTAWFASGISTYKSNNITITLSDFYDKEIGIYLSDSDYVKIFDNHFWECGHGIDSMGSSRYLEIHDNLIHDMYHSGIDVNNWDEPLSYAYVHIYDCEVYNIGNPISGGLYGIAVYNVFGSIIERCTVSNGVTGIMVQKAPNSIVRNCTISNHSQSGIALYTGIVQPLQFKEFSIIEHCDIYNCSMGIQCYATLKTRIQKNNIYHNSEGLFVTKVLVPFRLSFVRVNYNNIRDNNRYENFSAGVMAWRGNGDFRYNWWGATDGPQIQWLNDYYYDLNLSYGGSGNAILRHFAILFYRPFLREPVDDAGRQS